MNYDAMDKLVFAFMYLLVAVVFTALCLVAIYTPTSLSADSECLAKGYPKSTVTWDFKKYCMNLEGTITVEVEAL